MQLSLFWLSFSFFGVNVRSRSHSLVIQAKGADGGRKIHFFQTENGDQKGVQCPPPQLTTWLTIIWAGYTRRAYHFISALHIKQATLALVFFDANFLYLELKKSEYKILLLCF